jgi:hypothetical protein
MRKLVPCSPIRGGQFVCISKNAINILKVYTVVVNLVFQQHNTGKKTIRPLSNIELYVSIPSQLFFFFPSALTFYFIEYFQSE